MNKLTNEKASRTAGITYTILAYALWGVLPIYWKLLKQVPANEILAHRIVWSFVFVSGILVFTSQWDKLLNALKNKKCLGFIALCSVLIAINWGVYIWAVNSDHVLESSMGYYINPLMTVLLGTLVLKEKMNIWQYVALGLASLGVIFMAVQYGSVPWIALALSSSFALYGLCKKMVVAESLVGLALETVILTPLALVFLLYKHILGTGAFGTISLPVTILLAGAGIATATPLLWFAKGTRRIELTTIGFLQYFSPTITLFLGIFVFKEHFTKVHFISFGFIWCGLLVYTLSKLSFVKDLQPAFLKIFNNSVK